MIDVSMINPWPATQRLTTTILTRIIAAIEELQGVGIGTGELNPEPTLDHSVSGTTIPMTATEAQAFGDVVRIASTGKTTLAKADVIANAGAVLMCADASIAPNATGKYLLVGVARDDSWNWTVGGLVYLSATGTSGNTLTQTAPSGADNVVQIVGVATHADRLLFQPSLSMVEHV